MIGVSHISMAFAGNCILSDVTFSAQKGRMLGILGPNGSGKTTLIRLISAQIKPQAGAIYIQDSDVRRFKPKALARRIAVVPQSASTNFAFTAWEVAMMGRIAHMPLLGGQNRADEDIVREAMQSAGVWHLRNSAVTHLSGGEWQRVLLARALAQKVEALLLDEPVAALDVIGQIQTLSLVKQGLDEEHLAIAVLHDLNLAAHFCDDILMLKNGKVAHFGPTKTTLTVDAIGDVYGLSMLENIHPLTGETLFLPDYATTLDKRN